MHDITKYEDYIDASSNNEGIAEINNNDDTTGWSPDSNELISPWFTITLPDDKRIYGIDIKTDKDIPFTVTVEDKNGNEISYVSTMIFVLQFYFE